MKKKRKNSQVQRKLVFNMGAYRKFRSSIENDKSIVFLAGQLKKVNATSVAYSFKSTKKGLRLTFKVEILR